MDSLGIRLPSLVEDHGLALVLHTLELPLVRLDLISNVPFTEVLVLLVPDSPFEQFLFLGHQNSFHAKRTLLMLDSHLPHLFSMGYLGQSVPLFYLLQSLDPLLLPEELVLHLLLMPVSCFEELFCFLVGNIRQFLGSLFLIDESLDPILNHDLFLLAVSLQVSGLEHLQPVFDRFPLIQASRVDDTHATRSLAKGYMVVSCTLELTSGLLPLVVVDSDTCLPAAYPLIRVNSTIAVDVGDGCSSNDRKLLETARLVYVGTSSALGLGAVVSRHFNLYSQ